MTDLEALCKVKVKVKEKSYTACPLQMLRDSLAQSFLGMCLCLVFLIIIILAQRPRSKPGIMTQTFNTWEKEAEGFFILG